MQVRCLEHADGVVRKGASELFPLWEGCIRGVWIYSVLIPSQWWLCLQCSHLGNIPRLGSIYTISTLHLHMGEGYDTNVLIRGGTRTQLYNVPTRDRSGAILFPSGEGFIYTCYQGVVMHLCSVFGRGASTSTHCSYQGKEWVYTILIRGRVLSYRVYTTLLKSIERWGVSKLILSGRGWVHLCLPVLFLSRGELGEWVLNSLYYMLLSNIKIILFFLGLPNTFGGYDETPEMTAEQLKASVLPKSIHTPMEGLLVWTSRCLSGKSSLAGFECANSW